jgi:signal transduction histidine kinase/DNA-binding NarL/FixJ family response regulator
MLTTTLSQGCSPSDRAVPRQCILLVETDEGVASLVRAAISGARQLVLEHETTLSGAIDKLRSLNPSVVLIRTELADSRGSNTISDLRRARPDVPIVAIGNATELEAKRMEAAGAQACLDDKGITRASVQRAISSALTKRPGPETAGRDSAIATSLTIGHLLISADGGILGCNAAMTRMLGYSASSEAVGADIKSLMLDPEPWSSWLAMHDDIETTRIAMRRRDGGEIFLHGDIRRKSTSSGAVAGFELLLIDGTEQHQLGLALQSTARAGAVAALTGGVAHDFNNLLTIIVGNLYLLVESVRDNEALLGKAKIARDAARRGADLTKQLLSFARQKEADPQTIHLPVAIQNLNLLLERALGSKVTLTSRVAEDSWPICVDVSQLESALINLTVNARDAMQGEGTVVIGAANVTLEPSEAKRLSLQPGEYVEVYVADDGPGIPDKIKDRIFEPFFTTKGNRGSGLGLSMVRHFVALARGAIDIDRKSAAGGTIIRLLFPRTREREPSSVDMTQPLSTLPTGNEKVLVLCSDREVGTTIRQLLDVLGYAVAMAQEREAALQMLSEHGADILLCELPRGQQEPIGMLIRTARERCADLKALLIVDDAKPDHLPNGSIDGLLRKPFSLADVAKTVRRALDG